MVTLEHLGTSLSAVHDSVAAVQREGVLKFRQALLCEFITGVNHPPVRLWDKDTKFSINGISTSSLKKKKEKKKSYLPNIIIII